MRKLATKESLALQAMSSRAGIAAVLDELSMLAEELVADDDAWQEVASAIHEACNAALRVQDER